jgi:serine/threonine-protein kinase
MILHDWARIEDLFAHACALAAQEREDFLQRTCGGDEALRAELGALLQAHDAASGFLETPLHTSRTSTDAHSLRAGERFGAWSVIRLLGRGGMGEVYEVRRVDGTFEQRAALKLLRGDAAAEVERFQVERNVLARLDHPGIVRLLDGGVASDGRPWAVLDYVEGKSITEWCRAHGSSLAERLRLFAQVCEAVACAHRSLVVHRDLKPSNILVDTEGRVRLLDFGIAKLLDPLWKGDVATALSQTPLTPEYCAPEQLTGEPVTTATDVYTLGLLLFELITGTRPWSTQGLPLARVLRMRLETSAPLASAMESVNAPVPPRLLRGDLDAIVARCLRTEPAHRYATVDALKLDIERSRAGSPVAARGGARTYVFGRFLRRYRWAVAAVVLLLLMLVAGIAGFAWQARRAQAQAERAEATKNFLIDVFAANDPRRAQDKPRGALTARDLLDMGAERIEKEFGGKPELQVELLGVTAQIYSEIGEQERYSSQHRRYLELARRFYGDAHPIAIEAQLQEANHQAEDTDFQLARNEAEALRVLDEIDPLIRRAGLDETPTRALWWKIRGTTLYWNEVRHAEDEDAWRHAIDLYARTDPHDQHYPDALMVLASIENNMHEHPDRALTLLQRAREAQMQARGADDTNLAMIDDNTSRALRARGDFAAADAAILRAIDGYRRTWGENHAAYVTEVAARAQMHCEHGDYADAMRLFEPVLPLFSATNKGSLRALMSRIREKYGTCLDWVGRPDAAIAMLEAVEDDGSYVRWSPYSLARDRIALGDAYDRVGRYADARRSLKEGLDYRAAQNPEDSPRVLESRERWGRFLLTQGDATGALAEFHETIAQDHGRNLAFTALAHAGLAREALQRSDAAAALAASRQAQRTYENVSGPRNARMEPYLWRTYAQALAASGDIAAARDFAQRALDAYRSYDDPASTEVADAEALVAQLRIAVK